MRRAIVVALVWAMLVTCGPPAAWAQSAWPADRVDFDDGEDLQQKMDAGDLGGASEAELEAILDLQDLQGSLTVPGQVNATGTPDGTTFLRGDGAWAPSGGGDAAMFEFCRGGGKGVGWDPVTRTYGATCAFYPWSAEIGGFDATDPLETGFHSTPTTAGGNQVETECDGVYDPIPECLADGEVIVKGAMADAILAHEMTRPGGKVYGHMIDGYRFTGWEVGICGEGNSCPRLRPPFNGFKSQSFHVFGNRQFIMEGNDTNQFDRVREGAALLVNTGADPSGLDPSTDHANTNRRQNAVGLSPSQMICSSWPCAPTDQGGLKGPADSIVGQVAAVPGTQTDPEAFCVEDDPASTGTCHDPTPALGEELWSHRYQCSSDGDCTGLDASTSSWTCTGFASTIRETIALTGQPFPVASSVNRGAGVGLSGSRFFIESVSANACSTTGLDVAFAGAWPWIEEEVGASTSNAVTLRHSSHLVDQTRPAYKNVQSLPASSRQYAVVASEVPNGSEWATGEVAIITDDTAAGDCTDAGADGQLDGGGSAVSECAWNGSAWVTSDCEASTGDPDTNGAAGCEDEGTAFAMMVAEGEGLDGVTVAHFSHPDANPIIDGTGIAGTRTMIRNSLFAHNWGRISDTSHWSYLENTFTGNDGGEDPLLSLGFVPFQTFCRNRLVHNETTHTTPSNAALITLGEGELAVVCENEFIGNRPSLAMFLMTDLHRAVFRDNRGIGNFGPIYRAYNDGTFSTFGSFTIDGDTWLAHQSVSPGVNDGASNGEFPAAVQMAGVFASSGHSGEYVGPYIIDGLVVETNGDGALVFIEDGANDATSAFLPAAERFDIRNSRIDSNDGGSVAGIVRGAQTGFGGPGSGITFAEFENVFSDRHLPRWKGVYANGVKLPDWPYATIDSANGPTCVLTLTSATTQGEVIPGTRQAINDANAGAATDACDNDQDGILLGADGAGDAAPGTDMRVCECQDVASSPQWTAVYP